MKKNNKKLLKDLEPAIVISFAVCFMLLVFAPIEIFFSNQSQFWFEMNELFKIIAIMMLIAMALMTVFFAILRIISVRIYNYAVLLEFIALVATYIQGNFLLAALPGLDGTEIDWTNYTTQNVITAAIWIILTAAIVICCKLFTTEKVKKTAGGISVCLTLMLLITGFTVMISKPYEGKDYSMTVTDNDEFLMSTDRNFVILLLDAMDAEIYQEVAKDHPEYKEILEDFTFYENTTCGYTFTKQSIPYILSGKWYENERSFEEYSVDAFKSSPFLNKMKSSSYRMGLYETDIYSNDKTMYDFDNIINSKSNVTSYYTFAKREIQIVGYKYAPYFLKKFCAITAEDFADFRSAPEDGELFSPVNKVFYDTVDEGAIKKTDDKSFRFIHLEGAHVPFRYDKDMNVIENGTYEQNVEACMTLTDKYLKALKANGVYDNSVIVIMADHGFNNPDEPSGRQNPVLFIKGVGEKHDFKVSKAPIAFDDLQDGFSKLLDGKPGDSIFPWKEGDYRERRYLLFSYTQEEIMEEYVQKGHASDESTLVKSGKVYKRAD